MAKKIDSTLRAEIERLAKGIQWDLPGAWQASHNAIAVARTVLRMARDSKLADTLADTPEAKTLRAKIVEAILPPFESGAAINSRRGWMVDEKIAPAMAEKADRKADSIGDLA